MCARHHYANLCIIKCRLQSVANYLCETHKPGCLLPVSPRAFSQSGLSSSSESKHPKGKGSPTYILVMELVSKLGSKGMGLNTDGSPPAPVMSLQGATGSSRPMGGRTGAARTARSMTWGTGVSHIGGTSARRVGVGATGGAPGAMLVLARSLERGSVPSAILGAPLGHGVP